ncbi:MAG: hypothetical protein QXJ51_05100 [Sulfolobales archaeon]
MSSIEDLKKIIINSIEENKDPLVKAAYYSDKDVSSIVSRLIDRWEKSGYRGVPLDYATYEELRILASKAEFYRDAPREAYLRRLISENLENP